ncbi:HugZ family protein [Mesorhizobium sp. IMUNJ 23232]|uniref:HugZ family protein n=1 Tax=Mesorhizobium sp. IMUNJ 23232 TaxID=3376064 RepID=UPI003788AF3E
MDEKRDVIRPTDDEAVRLAKTLLRAARYGAFAVLDPASGGPLASRVGVATDVDGAPLILVSMLSAHTKAITVDPRCSLLLGEPGKGDPLAHPRVTLICRATKLERGSPEQARAERRYLNKNPKAKLYVSLGDFHMFRLEIEGASLNGGFGKAYALTREDILTASPALETLAASEQGAIDHMNSDHGDAIALYAAHFARAAGGGWTMTGIDPDGFDLASGDEIRRVFFPTPLQASSELRAVLVEMARTARASAG